MKVLMSQIEELEQELDNLMYDFETGKIDGEEYRDKYQDWQERKASIFVKPVGKGGNIKQA